MVVREKGGREVELYSFALTDMVRWGYNQLRTLQSGFGEREMRGVPAIARAARIRAEAVANLDLGVWKGMGPDRVKVETCWQDKLFDNSPNDCQTRFDFWETVEESLAYRGNAFIWKNTSGSRIVEWWALHPDQVTPKNDGTYSVKVAPGYVDPTGKGPGDYPGLTNTTILHIRGHGQGGQLLAPSPVEQFRDAMAGPVGRQRHEARMWRRGVAGQLAVTFPAGISKDQADQWREAYRANYEGTEGETTLVMGGGAEIKPIGLTPADAEFVEMKVLTAQDASQIMGVPANLLGVSVQQKGTPNLEQDLMEWLRFGLGPELKRIEEALKADEQLFGFMGRLQSNVVGSMGIYPKFNTDDFVRGDNLTEATILVSDVQAGILLPDEARNIKGYPPLPDGAGKIPQITPVGGAPNATPPAPSGHAGPPLQAPKDTPDDIQAARVPDVHVHVPNEIRMDGSSLTEAFMRRDEQIEDALERLAVPPIVNVHVPETTLPTPEVHVPAPQVTVNVEPTPVQVNVPEQQMPDIHVNVPEQGDMEVERDKRGFITRVRRQRKEQ